MSDALYALDSEREVIGTCVLRGSIADAQQLVPGTFAELPYRAAWEAMQALTEKRQPIDPVTVAQEVRSQGHDGWFEKLGGVDEGLADAVGACCALNVEHHVRVVAAKSERRRWLNATLEIAALAKGEADDDSFMQEAERRMLELANTRTSSKDPEHSKAVMRRLTLLLAERVTQFKGGKVAGIPTGYAAIDRLLGGLVGGRLYVLAARPAMGKSALALNTAYLSGTPTLLFGLEMTADESGLRLVSSEGRIDSRRLETGDFGDPGQTVVTWRKIHQAMGKLVEAPLWFEDHSDLTITEMRSTARRWRMRHAAGKPALVVVDYLQLVGGSRRKDQREQEVAEVSRQLKAMAKELDAPVLALAQLNRELEKREDKRPKLSDLRESGAVEQDANVVMFLYRDEVYCPDCTTGKHCDREHKGDAEVIVSKNRHGPTATARLRWVPQFTSFEAAS